MNELKPLFVFKRLNGKLLYESNESTNIMPAWHSLPVHTQELFERAAKRLNAQLSLCWRCGERSPLTQPHLICEPCQKKGRVFTQSEFERIINEQDADFCDCCGSKMKIVALFEAQMPDLDQPEITEAGTSYPLLGGFHVCLDCQEHCEDGPCWPGNLVAIVEDQPGQDETPHEELARQVQHELNVQQTFPSQFSSYEAYEEWREQND